MSDTLLKSRKQVRVYLGEEETEYLERLVESKGITETKIANLIVNAGLKELSKQDGMLRLPIVFSLQAPKPK